MFYVPSPSRTKSLVISFFERIGILMIWSLHSMITNLFVLDPRLPGCDQTDHFVFGTLGNDPLKYIVLVIVNSGIFQKPTCSAVWEVSIYEQGMRRFYVFFRVFIHSSNLSITATQALWSMITVGLLINTYRMIFWHSVFFCHNLETTRFHTLAGGTCLAESFFSTLLLK